jgi:hypothetical protein
MVKLITGMINKLAETYHLTVVLLVVFGSLLLAIASVGGVPQFEINIDTFWRYLLGGCGVAMVAVGLLSVIVNFFFPPHAPPASSIKAGVTFEEPAHDAHILVPFPVSGKYEKIPRGYQLWLFNIGGQGRGLEYYPQSEIRPRDGRWATEFRATSFQRGHKRKFAIFLVGENGQALVHHYNASGKALNQVEPKMERHWTPLTYLTSDIVQATEIREVTLEGAKPASA